LFGLTFLLILPGVAESLGWDLDFTSLYIYTTIIISLIGYFSYPFINEVGI